MISFDDFKKLEIKIGEIKAAERVPETDKLLRLTVDFGLKQSSGAVEPEQKGGTSPVGAVQPLGRDVRQIISGIALYFPDPTALIGKKCAFAANLEPRVIKDLESQGMILAVGGGAEPFSLLEVRSEVKAGAIVK